MERIDTHFKSYCLMRAHRIQPIKTKCLSTPESELNNNANRNNEIAINQRDTLQELGIAKVM